MKRNNEILNKHNDQRLQEIRDSTIPLVELQNDNVYSFSRCPSKLLLFSPWYTLFPDDNKLLSPTTSWNSSTRLHLLC